MTVNAEAFIGCVHALFLLIPRAGSLVKQAVNHLNP
jgi:hypothetical protein